jgi:hypothetical protein
MTDFFSSPFAAQINSLIRNDSVLSKRYKRVKGKISDYALSINLSPDDLLVTHVADDRAYLSKGFTSFIENLPGKPESTPERIKIYRGEIYSDVRRLVKAVFANATSVESEESRTGNNLSGSFLERQAPKWMDPLLDVLSRTTESGGDGWVPKGVSRLKYPLTANSVAILSVLLKVAKISKCSSLKSLLVDCRFEILAELKLRHFGNRLKCLRGDLDRKRLKLGYRLGRPALQSLPFEQWSPKFQKQWSKFEELALSGVSEGSPLGKMANNHKMSLGKSKPVTINSSKEVICTGLFHCQPLPEDWGVEDLLSLDVRTTVIAGVEHPETYNHFIDRYHIREQNRVSKVKRKGFNSGIFENFINALSTVAGFNGLFHHVDPFRRAYRSNLDVESKRLNKDNKKRLFSISEIDENIARLELEFNQIVKDRSFENQVGVSKHVTKKNMRLCLFLPLFVTLRYLGVRQRNVRNFRLMGNPENPNHPDGNVGFRKDGTLVIHYTDIETKNGKPIHLEFNLPDFETHAPLIRILKTYYKKVYPYILQHAATPLEGQLFVYMPKRFAGRFVSLPDKPAAIDYLFVYWGDEFLNFKNITAKNYVTVNPHFMRGLCTDWLVNVLHFTLEEAAEYIADTVEMLRKEYLDRNRVHDATFIIEEKNRALRAGKLEREAIEKARQAAEQEKIEVAKRAEREDDWQKQMNRMEETMDRAEALRVAQDIRLAASEARADSLAADNARLTGLLIKKMGVDATTL